MALGQAATSPAKLQRMRVALQAENGRGPQPSHTFAASI
jgi:hypothetical protein